MVSQGIKSSLSKIGKGKPSTRKSDRIAGKKAKVTFKKTPTTISKKVVTQKTKRNSPKKSSALERLQAELSAKKSLTASELWTIANVKKLEKKVWKSGMTLWKLNQLIAKEWRNLNLKDKAKWQKMQDSNGSK